MERSFIRLGKQGFSLIEMLIGMGLISFIIVLSANVHITNLQIYKTTESRVSLTQDSLLLVEYFRNQVIAAGGGSIRSWMGIWVEDNCAARGVLPQCAGSDRLTVTSTTLPVQECSITGMVNPNVLQIAFSSPGVCCLQPATAAESSFSGRQIMISRSDYFRQRYVSTSDLNLCRLTIQPGQAAGGDQAGPIVNWTGGVVTMVSVDTIYWDSVTRMLKRFTDNNNNGQIDAGEDMIVADSLFEFQVALGYDFNPGDGNVTSSANGIGDEWLYNAPTAIEAINTPPFVAPMARSSLLLVEVGAILGSSAGGSNLKADTARILNGPVRTMPGWILQAETTRLAQRNSFIFQ